MAAKKKTSVALHPRDIERFTAAADDMGVSLSVFLKRCADKALTPPDTAQDFKLLAADLRSDLRKELSRVSEQNATLTNANAEHLRELFTGFLMTLHDDQKEILMKASGLTPRETPHRKSNYSTTTPSAPGL